MDTYCHLSAIMVRQPNKMVLIRTQLLRRLSSCTTFPSSIIPFTQSVTDKGERLYSTLCNTVVYEEHRNSIHGEEVVLVDCYSNETKISKSDTQGVTFLRM